jgi:hypothetical protein
MSKINVTFRSALGSVFTAAVDAGTSLRQAFNQAVGKTYGAIDHQEITAEGAKVSKEKKLSADLEVAVVLKGETAPVASSATPANTETASDSVAESTTTTETSNANTADTAQSATEGTATDAVQGSAEQAAEGTTETANAQPAEGVKAETETASVASASGIEAVPVGTAPVVEKVSVTFKGMGSGRGSPDIIVQRNKGTPLSEFLTESSLVSVSKGKRFFDQTNKSIPVGMLIQANMALSARAASSGG